jgi:hypothetical protein
MNTVNSLALIVLIHNVRHQYKKKQNSPILTFSNQCQTVSISNAPTSGYGDEFRNEISRLRRSATLPSELTRTPSVHEFGFSKLCQCELRPTTVILRIRFLKLELSLDCLMQARGAARTQPLSLSDSLTQSWHMQTHCKNGMSVSTSVLY